MRLIARRASGRRSTSADRARRYPDGQTNNAVVAHFIVEWPNPDRALSGPGWFGYPLPKAPETVQIFIDSNTHSHFRFFAIAILTTMLLKESTIAWFRLKDGYKQAITTINTCTNSVP
jgi:hypothetical protein